MKQIIHHIDGNRLNNSSDNLAYIADGAKAYSIYKEKYERNKIRSHTCFDCKVRFGGELHFLCPTCRELQ